MGVDSFEFLQQKSVTLEENLRNQMHRLNERIKELQCLYSIAELGTTQTTLSEMLQQMVEILPPAWQFPEVACARIRAAGKEFQTKNFRMSEWCQSHVIEVLDQPAGSVEICYLEPRPESDEGPFLKEERRLLQTICRLIGQMIERKQAEEELRSLSTELSLAEQRERLRIATHLHDEVAQPLATLKISLGALQQNAQSEKITADVSAMREMMDHTITTIRGLSFELAPPVLYNFGFEAALQELLQKVEDQHGIKVHYQKKGDAIQLNEGLQVLLYTMSREIILNVIKHANSKHLDVVVSSEKQLTITFEDDGKGFDSSNLEKRLKKDSGFGLFSIRERIRQFGGRLTIESTPGKGTRAILWVSVI